MIKSKAIVVTDMLKIIWQLKEKVQPCNNAGQTQAFIKELPEQF
jgi:hypothetical protein